MSIIFICGCTFLSFWVHHHLEPYIKIPIHIVHRSQYDPSPNIKALLLYFSYHQQLCLANSQLVPFFDVLLQHIRRIHLESNPFYHESHFLLPQVLRQWIHHISIIYQPYSVFPDKYAFIHSRYASAGTPHLLWNHSAAIATNSGRSLNVIIL